MKVSWTEVEQGWTVYDAANENIGQVLAVQGNPAANVFHGLLVVSGPFRASVYISAEKIAKIENGVIRLNR